MIGTTNQLIKTHKFTASDIVVDLDAETVAYGSEATEKEVRLNGQEKKFMQRIIQVVEGGIEEEERSWRSLNAF